MQVALETMGKRTRSWSTSQGARIPDGSPGHLCRCFRTDTVRRRAVPGSQHAGRGQPGHEAPSPARLTGPQQPDSPTPRMAPVASARNLLMRLEYIQIWPVTIDLWH